MGQADVLVVGAGPAGMAAAAELARHGLSSLLVEQRDQMGGAIYRRPAGSVSAALLPLHHRRHQHALSHGLAEAGARVQPMLESVLIGLERDGRFLIDSRRSGRVLGLRPKAVILALGSVERVQPRTGWELPGVISAGGMQVMLKETGQAPSGPILLAGSGPLLLALAAQLASAGRPPVAVLERARPFSTALHQGQAVATLLRSAPHLREVAVYAARLAQARVPYKTGWSAVAVRETPSGLVVAAQNTRGKYQEYLVRHLALHDGLVPNSLGLPEASVRNGLIVRAGDCREVLGAEAAIVDGRRAAQTVASRLGKLAQPDLQMTQSLATLQRTQAALTTLFQAPQIEPDPDTVVCRCEGLRRSDFDTLRTAGSARELRLVGRFGMGACQGRYCAHSVSDLARNSGFAFDPGALNGDIQRWPMRPVSVSALTQYTEFD